MNIPVSHWPTPQQLEEVETAARNIAERSVSLMAGLGPYGDPEAFRVASDTLYVASSAAWFVAIIRRAGLSGPIVPPADV